MMKYRFEIAHETSFVAGTLFPHTAEDGEVIDTSCTNEEFDSFSAAFKRACSPKLEAGCRYSSAKKGFVIDRAFFSVLEYSVTVDEDGEEDWEFERSLYEEGVFIAESREFLLHMLDRYAKYDSASRQLSYHDKDVTGKTYAVTVELKEGDDPEDIDTAEAFDRAGYDLANELYKARRAHMIECLNSLKVTYGEG